MSLKMKALKNGSWFALFKIISHTFSWVITIIIARILLPEDYALAAIATIITGYAEIFSELGLGASIIQRKDQTQKDLSSVFWFSFMISVVFAISCIPISYLTAYVFHEPKVIPLVQSVSLVFLFVGLQVVPLNMLQRDLNFKSYGMIELVTTVISTLGMVLIAYLGGGVWALIGGRIIRGFFRLIAVYYVVRWLPLFHFNMKEARHYLKFGVIVALGSSAYYLFEVSDRFFAGRAWSLEDLGYYIFALQLAQMPTDKIVALINTVTYSVLSRYQSAKDKFNELYLQIMRFTSTIVFPIFVGGFFAGGDFVKLLLGEKWIPIITLFESLCLVQIITALNALNNHVHTAMGHPNRALYFNSATAIFMSISFYFAVQYELHAILYPWFTTYFIITIVWVIYTLRILDISISLYIRNISIPVIGVLVMSLPLWYMNQSSILTNMELSSGLIVKVIVAGGTYLGFLWIFDRGVFKALKKLKSA